MEEYYLANLHEFYSIILIYSYSISKKKKKIHLQNNYLKNLPYYYWCKVNDFILHIIKAWIVSRKTKILNWYNLKEKQIKTSNFIIKHKNVTFFINFYDLLCIFSICFI